MDEKLKVCQYCGKAQRSTANYCKDCGKKNPFPSLNEANFTECHGCGRKIKSDAAFCIHCGAQVKGMDLNLLDMSKTTESVPGLKPMIVEIPKGEDPSLRVVVETEPPKDSVEKKTGLGKLINKSKLEEVKSKSETKNKSDTNNKRDTKLKSESKKRSESKSLRADQPKYQEIRTSGDNKQKVKYGYKSGNKFIPITALLLVLALVAFLLRDVWMVGPTGLTGTSQPISLTSVASGGRHLTAEPWTSGTKALDLEPAFGLRIQAEENALDLNRTFNVERMEQEQLVNLFEGDSFLPVVGYNGLWNDSRRCLSRCTNSSF